MAVVTHAGNRRLLARALSGFTPDAHDLALRLFKNDFTPDADSVFGDFVESTFGGYFRQWVDSSLWAAPLTVGEVARSTYTVDPFQWTATTGSQTVYGYYVVEDATGTVLWADRLATPRSVTVGSVLELTLAAEFGSCG